MSQKREKEETLDFKVPPSSKETTLSVAALCPENCKISATATQTCSGSTSLDSTRPDPVHPPPDHPDNTSDTRDSSSASEAVPKKPRQVRGAASSKNSAVNRCSGCGKRVGLTGFRCRCGDLFCSVHRYSDRHDCSFDYKAAGREAIARENPVVRAAKILKV